MLQEPVYASLVIIVSAQGPNPSFFSFLGGLLFDLGASWDKGLDSDLDQGLTIPPLCFPSYFDVDTLLLPLTAQNGITPLFCISLLV